MSTPHPRDLGLGQARALVQRAVDKAEQLGLRGAVAVVGATGTLITASRMDAGGPDGMARARSKAWISATQQIPSGEHLHRMTSIAPPVAAGFAQASPEALFPGAGGPYEPRPAARPDVECLAGLLTEGGLRTHALPDARGPQWTKVIFNSATSPLAALTGLPMGPLCTDTGLRAQVDALVREAMTVCERAGIVLERSADEEVEEAIVSAYDHKPSMLQDVLARRATEIDVLNGGIAAEGRRAGVPTPLHDCMVALVRGLEKSWSA